MKTKEGEKITYVVETDRGVFRMTIPDSWKVTYSKVIPSQTVRYSEEIYCLRIYESENKQRAVFLGVKNFYASNMIDIEVPESVDGGKIVWSRVEGEDFLGNLAFDGLKKMARGNK